MAENGGDEAPLLVDDETTKLRHLVNTGNLQYSLDRFEEAAETYSHAAMLQDKINGEMSPLNADILFLYGQCLFKLAIQKSDVLGAHISICDNKVEGSSEDSDIDVQALTEAFAIDDEEGELEDDEDEDEESHSDDNDTENENERQHNGVASSKGPKSEDEELDDDFGAAFDILDMARLLYQKQETDLQTASKSKGKETITDGPIKGLLPELKLVKEKLADTHGLQAEISLENERYELAIEDAKAALRLRKQVYNNESNLIAEAYYKLALSQSSYYNAIQEVQEVTGPQENSPTLIYEAIENQVLAIQSCKARIKQEESLLAEGVDLVKKKKSILDVEEIVKEMFFKLSELKATAQASFAENDQTSFQRMFSPEVMHILDQAQEPVSVKELLATKLMMAELLGKASERPAAVAGGTMAEIPGETATDRDVRIADAKAKTNDLTGLVVKKKKETQNGQGIEKELTVLGKRKIQPEAGDDPADSKDMKKVCVGS